MLATLRHQLRQNHEIADKMLEEAIDLFEDAGYGADEADDSLLAPVHGSNQDRYVRFSPVMDSGAGDHVTNRNTLPEVPVQPSPGSRRGQVYSAAGGKAIANEGEQVIPLISNEGARTQMTYQVAEVRRPLCSIARLCDRGNRVVFGRGGGVVQNLSTGRCSPFRREGAIYIMDLWFDTQNPNPFVRQG